MRDKLERKKRVIEISISIHLISLKRFQQNKKTKP